MNRLLRKYVVALAALFLLLAGQGEWARAQQFALRSNALTDVLLTPDFGVEVVAGENMSVALSVAGNWKPYGMDCRLVGVQPQWRYWFGGRPLVREYVGVSALFCAYDLSWKDSSYAGLAGGVGITGGYVLPLSPRWGVEFSGGVSLLGFGQKRGSRYDNYEDLSSDEYNSRGYKLLPTNIGVTFIFIIK